MARESPLGALSRLSAPSLGVFRGRAAVELGVSRKQIAAFRTAGVVVRLLPDTYRDDPTNYEHDNEKWSVPGRHGYRIVFATWDKATRAPRRLLAELTATLAA